MSPLLSPEGLRVVVVGGVLLVAVLGADLALQLTGHGTSPLATTLTKGLESVVGAAAIWLAARAPSGAQIAADKKDRPLPPPAPGSK